MEVDFSWPPIEEASRCELKEYILPTIFTKDDHPFSGGCCEY